MQASMEYNTGSRKTQTIITNGLLAQQVKYARGGAGAASSRVIIESMTLEGAEGLFMWLKWYDFGDMMGPFCVKCQNV